MKPVAVVGFGLRFPDSPDPGAFWNVIREGRDTSKPVPDGRWTLSLENALGGAQPEPDRVLTERGCFIDLPQGDLGDLDEQLAQSIDISARLAVIAGVEAARHHRGQLDPDSTRVILGQLLLPTDSTSAIAEAVIGDTVEELVLESMGAEDRRPRGIPRCHPLDRYDCSLPAAALHSALRLRGGSFTLDAACASSLYAISCACRDLAAHRCDAVLAGGVSRPDGLFTQMGFSQLRALSPEGRCRPLDQRGQGLLVGEGAGVLLLKRLEDAISSGDRVWGVIRGSGLSNDRSGGLLAPSGEGQLRAMRSAYRSADWSPEDIDYIECHATGTPVGDATELRSLMALWDSGAWRPGQCALGSVKACIGHTLTAAGAAGVIKVLLAMDRGEIPGLPGHETPPDGIDLSDSPFRIPHRSESWPRRSGQSRRAAVSAFGFGGINAHILIEEAPTTTESTRVTVPRFPSPASRIAIIGLGAIAGRHQGIDAVAQAVLGHSDTAPREPMPGDMGIPKTRWAREARLEFPAGESCGRLRGSPVELRIPPTELSRMLPQQLALLQVSREALACTSLEQLGERGGLFVGLGIDPRGSLPHLRWMIPHRARRWLRELGMDSKAPDIERWISALQDEVSAPLDANRVMGSLGSIAASRVARDLQAGGPSHTISADEISGFRAMEMAIRALQDHQLDVALAAAADLGLDILTRTLDSQDQLPPRVDAAAAVVLKRLEDVSPDDGPIIATIDGMGSACTGDLERPERNSTARISSRAAALDEASLDPSGIDLICSDETSTASIEPLAGRPGWQVTLPPEMASSGSVAFLMSLLQGTLAASRGVIPGVHPNEPVPWAADGADRRRVLIENSGKLGAATSMVISTEEVPVAICAESIPPPRCIGEPKWGVICVEADDESAFTGRLERFRSDHLGGMESAASIARRWLSLNPRNEGASRAISIVFQDELSLRAAVDSAAALLAGSSTELKGQGWELHRSSETPLGYSGDLTFLYPGSGSLYPGAGRELFARYPGALDRTALTVSDLARWLAAPESWQPDADLPTDPRDAILAQVTLGCIGTDLLLGCGIDPERAAGHSLGETTMLFALRAWRDRQAMQQQMENDDLFTDWLAGGYRAAAREWSYPPGRKAHWAAAVIDGTEQQIRHAISSEPRLELLVVNASNETVIGGDPEVLERMCNRHGWTSIPLQGVTSVHCRMVSQVASRYRALHHWPVYPPVGGVTLHSTATGLPLVLDSDGVADSIMLQATDGFDFPHLIESLWQAGSRIFIEPGPGASCSRLAHKALEGRPHRTLPLFWRGEAAELSLARILAVCIAERAPGKLEAYLGSASVAVEASDSVDIEDGQSGIVSPPLPTPGIDASRAVKTTPALHDGNRLTPAGREQNGKPSDEQPRSISKRLERARRGRRALHPVEDGQASQGSVAPALAEPVVDHSSHDSIPTSSPAPLFDRQKCLEFAAGQVGPVLGPLHAPADQFPTRVRLPEEPLMLVDRIVSMEGDPLTLGPGRIVTEHDVLPGAWYLDAGRIPTSIAVESGQADLFLSAFLGADLHTRGLSVYRLLDAQVVFHDDLPTAGNTIVYDIHIDEFFRQDQTLLFRFHFEGSVAGKPLISMRDGCAGFFSPEELASGRGIIQAPHRPRPKALAPAGWMPPAGTEPMVLDESSVDALRRGDLGTALGERFRGLPLQRPCTLPGGKMRLLDRVTAIEPVGGDWGLGRAVAELAIHPDDWFLTSHFRDDPVMPGTLMYECCLHTLRTLLIAWGWVGEEDEVIPMPVPDVAGRLRCRGQVVPGTAMVSYEVQVKEIGFRPEPYVITDATMFADGRPIVEMEGMSLRLAGLDRQRIDAIWSHQHPPRHHEIVAETERQIPPQAPGGGADSPVGSSAAATLYDHDQILEFCNGRPSLAFGDRYSPFDGDRFIARLPGPPYCFLDRIIDVQGKPWQVEVPAACTSEYFPVPDAWYFDASGVDEMPFAVLLEIALQPCGWLAAYVGSALTSDQPLQFRNLGGSATLLKPIGRDIGLLTTTVQLTSADHAAGMWIQHYDIEVRDGDAPIYRGNTYFGFFPAEALAQQVGLPGAVARTIPPREALRGRSFMVPPHPDGPSLAFQMIDEVELFVPDGGTAGHGFIRGAIDVDRESWFFRAHFKDDPVWPGSLGLESMLQLLQLVARERWGDEGNWLPRTLAPGVPHKWTYRGQVIPDRKRVVVEANIKSVDDQRGILVADGMLLVDDLAIYSMEDFSIERRDAGR
ncbi:MAG: beta-ketoacyl synthase N-terminal-like domain-containing protein [Planctomycetota bacterium]|nr:beta-ketoacyl synthase N-terminal-like domain-containing protein [Planctomycetota bacterium]